MIKKRISKLKLVYTIELNFKFKNMLIKMCVFLEYNCIHLDNLSQLIEYKKPIFAPKAGILVSLSSFHNIINFLLQRTKKLLPDTVRSSITVTFSQKYIKNVI